jgi:hypothetical protein
MEREELVAQIDFQFKELAVFARQSWSNIDIAERVKAMHEEVRKLYPPVIVEVKAPPIPEPPEPVAPPKAVSKPRQPAKPRVRRVRTYRAKTRPTVEPQKFEPIHVEANTRWG